VVEVNNGGDMVTHTLRTVRPGLPIEAVHASRGKLTRAEPIAALYEQGRVWHTVPLAELEDQLCTWVPESGTSPDRLDALVWACTALDLAGAAVPRLYVF
jgi:phage terminase large subunit-like protein